MILWALAANCHLGELKQLPSQISQTATDVQHVWNKRTPREQLIPRVNRDFTVQPEAREASAQSWAKLNSALRSDTKRAPRRMRRFIPDYQSDSAIGWEEIADAMNGSRDPE
jgi:hypothetical protein